MRLIDADALQTRILMDAPNAIDGGSAITKAFIMAMIKTRSVCPTIDAVQVVRCKDCKHAEPWYSDKSRCFLWHESGIDVFQDGFCNYGEKAK